MLITDKIFEAFLNCETKAFLYLNGETGEESEITVWRRHLNEEFKRQCRQRLLLNVAAEQWMVGTPPLTRLKQGRYQAIFDYELTGESIRSRVHALVKTHAPRKAKIPYSPIRFVTRHKIVASDKFLVAFDALALFEGWHAAPPVGQILYGQGAITTFRLVGLLNQVKRMLGSIANESRKNIPVGSSAGAQISKRSRFQRPPHRT
jgi:hypothetical protein